MTSIPTNGYFAKGNEIIGRFDFSFSCCRYSFIIFDTHEYQHYLKDVEIENLAKRRGWEILPASAVEIIYRRK